MALDFDDPFLVARRRELDRCFEPFEADAEHSAPAVEPDWWAVVSDWMNEREPRLGEWMAKLSVRRVPSFDELLERLGPWPEARRLRLEGEVLGRKAWTLWKGPLLLRLIVLEHPERAPSRAELLAALGPTAALLSDLRVTLGVRWLSAFFAMCDRPIPETAVVWGPPAMAELVYALLRETHPRGSSSVHVGPKDDLREGFEQSVDLFAPQFVFVHGHRIEVCEQAAQEQSNPAHALPVLVYRDERGIFGRPNADECFLAERPAKPIELEW